MPKIKQLEKCKHPNSRKTKALTKQIKKYLVFRQNVREKLKLGTNIKNNLLGEKILWFKEHLAEDEKVQPEVLESLILKYIDRFNDELEQINLKHAIGQRKNRQHASRQDIINLTIKREKEEFDTCGIELPDVFNRAQFKMLKTWNGELRFIQNFKLKRFSKNSLKEIQNNLASKTLGNINTNEKKINEKESDEKNMDVDIE